MLEPWARALLLTLCGWPDAVAEACRSPHRVAAYLTDTARGPIVFYHRCRVMGETPDRMEMVRYPCGDSRA
ncbi:MAG: DALR anticodon-binding domain-containing protein [Actinomycetota bacterium]|nr:DALR anticodon-binding domain-containing protein [Actinomycetota bacterium]